MIDEKKIGINVKPGTILTEEYLDSRLEEFKASIIEAIANPQRPKEPEPIPEPEPEPEPIPEPEPEPIPEPEPEPGSHPTPCLGGPDLIRVLSVTEKQLQFEFWGMNTSVMYIKIKDKDGHVLQKGTLQVFDARPTVNLIEPLNAGRYTLTIRPLNCSHKETEAGFIVGKECDNCKMEIGNIVVL